MLHNRLRVCLKFALLFAIAVSLPGTFAQSGSRRAESVMVFAPHPDDEVIGCAGVIQQALARGARVTVVDITSGDGFPAAAAGVTHKPVDQVGPDDFLRFRACAKPRAAVRLKFWAEKTMNSSCLGIRTASWATCTRARMTR